MVLPYIAVFGRASEVTTILSYWSIYIYILSAFFFYISFRKESTTIYWSSVHRFFLLLPFLFYVLFIWCFVSHFFYMFSSLLSWLTFDVGFRKGRGRLFVVENSPVASSAGVGRGSFSQALRRPGRAWYTRQHKTIFARARWSGYSTWKIAVFSSPVFGTCMILGTCLAFWQFR